MIQSSTKQNYLRRVLYLANAAIHSHAYQAPHVPSILVNFRQRCAASSSTLRNLKYQQATEHHLSMHRARNSERTRLAQRLSFQAFIDISLQNLLTLPVKLVELKQNLCTLIVTESKNYLVNIGIMPYCYAVAEP